MGGILVESFDVKIKPLGEVLSRYIEKKFTGYIVYVNREKQTRGVIGLIDGNIVLCKIYKQVPIRLEVARKRGSTMITYRSTECYAEIANYLKETTGSIEIYSLDRDVLLMELLTMPQTRIEVEDPTLAKTLGMKAGIPVKTPLPAHTPQPPPPPPLPPPQQPQAQPPPTLPQPLRVEAPRADVAERFRVSDECIDPLTLYKMIRSSQLEDSQQGPLNYRDLLQRFSDIENQKKPVYIYASANIEDYVLRMLYNPRVNDLYVELEKEGKITCGKSAVDQISKESMVNVRIWIAK